MLRVQWKAGPIHLCKARLYALCSAQCSCVLSVGRTVEEKYNLTAPNVWMDFDAVIVTFECKCLFLTRKRMNY